MARLAKRPTPEESDDETNSRTVTSRSRNLANRRATATPESGEASTSPTTATSSDKENRASLSRNARGKQKMAALGNSTRDQQQGANKRRRTGDRDSSRAVSVLSEEESEQEEGSQDRGLDRVSLRKALNDITDTRFYDPEQDPRKRREYRSRLGALAKELTDNKNEYLQADNDGLFQTVGSANKLFNGVKQTSDATLDAKHLVNAADLAGKRAVQNKYGASEMGVDVDEFVTKCVAFMRRGPSDSDLSLAPQASQRRRPIRDDSDSDGDPSRPDDGDELNWSWLGLRAAFPSNVRPPTPGFLLGPLSVSKKIRKLTQRRARQERRDPADAKRPDEIGPEHIERQENANLTALCHKIFKILTSYQDRQGYAVQTAIEEESARLDRDLTEDEINDVCLAHNLDSDGNVCLINFAFNPQSFGQTVENLFYISFLVRDGKAGITTDERGLIMIVPDPRQQTEGEDELSPEELQKRQDEQEKRNRSVKKYQAVLHIDFDMWREAIDAYGLKRCVIPHRVDDGGQVVSKTGWYA